MASQLKVDTLTGVTTAGSIVVTGEGNSTTTNLQQGLIKSWVNFDQDSAAIRQSFNTSGITDEGTGLSAVSYTNNFSYADYGIGGAFNRTGTDDFLNTYYNHTTSLTNYQHYSAGSSADSDDIGALVAGDLA